MHRKAGIAALGLFSLIGVTAELSAQGPPPVRSLAPIVRREQSRPQIPASLMPPAGMCRIWIDNVPSTQQPAPTDCASAIRNKPQNGRVIFSDEDEREKRDRKGASSRPGREERESKPKKPDPSGGR
jgi:hypothetical protein